MQQDTENVLDFMMAFGQPVRDVPTTDISDEERILRVRLVIEEALEFAEAMGCVVLNKYQEVSIDVDDFTIENNYFRPTINLVEAADALGDLIYVTKGSAHTLGVPIDDISGIIHHANMEKLDPTTGKPINDVHGKVIKPEGWVAPDKYIEIHLNNLMSGRVNHG